MSTAFEGSSWNSSEVSSDRISPSCEGTSATSLISCVCTDIGTTLVKGITIPIPGDSVDDDTLPKKSFTPTWPAGTVRIGPAAKNTMRTTTMIATVPTRLDERGKRGRLTSSDSMKGSPYGIFAYSVLIRRTTHQHAAGFRAAACRGVASEPVRMSGDAVYSPDDRPPRGSVARTCNGAASTGCFVPRLQHLAVPL